MLDVDKHSADSTNQSATGLDLG